MIPCAATDGRYGLIACCMLVGSRLVTPGSTNITPANSEIPPAVLRTIAPSPVANTPSTAMYSATPITDRSAGAWLMVVCT